MNHTNSEIHSLYTLADEVGRRLLSAGLVLTTAESCTGGGIAQAVTEVAGSSQWFDCGFVTYSNRAKMALLGVEKETLDEVGAVSPQVVAQMVRGAIGSSGAQVAVAVSGVAGPGGGSPDKPVGTVWFAWYFDGGVETERHLFSGDRSAVRHATVVTALRGLLQRLYE